MDRIVHHEIHLWISNSKIYVFFTLRVEKNHWLFIRFHVGNECERFYEYKFDAIRNDKLLLIRLAVVGRKVSVTNRHNIVILSKQSVFAMKYNLKWKHNGKWAIHTVDVIPIDLFVVRYTITEIRMHLCSKWLKFKSVDLLWLLK